MAEPGTSTTTPLSAEDKRAQERRQQREAKLPEALLELDRRHEVERNALSKKLRELADRRKVIQDQVWAQQGDGASSAAATAAAGKGERDEEKQAWLKELLPERNELHVEVQRLLEVLDKEELRRVYERRIQTEDTRTLKAWQRTEAAKRAGLWRFVSKKKVEAKRREVEQEGSAEGDLVSVDSRLGYPKLPEIYEEIKKLLDIEKNPIFSKALQEWNRKEELLSRRVERKKNRVASLKNEVYQLFGFFSVFQGVVLTAVSQSSRLFCHNQWSPIALSVLASVISIFGVIQKLNQIQCLQRNVEEEERDFAAAVQAGLRLRQAESKGIDFSSLSVEIDNNLDRKSKLSKKRFVANLYFWLVILALVAFGVLFPVSFWRILCKPGAPPPAQ